MAVRGSTKAHSVTQEEFIADAYDGKRSASSGAADNDQGDVRAARQLFECKVTGGPGKPKTSKLLQDMEKVAEEAWSEGREPVVALRFFNPESKLANSDGWVDLTVRLMSDDSHRDQIFTWYQNGEL
jgi:hypothetical protein